VLGSCGPRTAWAALFSTEPRDCCFPIQCVQAEIEMLGGYPFRIEQMFPKNCRCHWFPPPPPFPKLASHFLCRFPRYVLFLTRSTTIVRASAAATKHVLLSEFDWEIRKLDKAKYHHNREWSMYRPTILDIARVNYVPIPWTMISWVVSNPCNPSKPCGIDSSQDMAHAPVRSDVIQVVESSSEPAHKLLFSSRLVATSSRIQWKTLVIGIRSAPSFTKGLNEDRCVVKFHLETDQCRRPFCSWDSREKHRHHVSLRMNWSWPNCRETYLMKPIATKFAGLFSPT